MICLKEFLENRNFPIKHFEEGLGSILYAPFKKELVKQIIRTRISIIGLRKALEDYNNLCKDKILSNELNREDICDILEMIELLGSASFALSLIIERKQISKPIS